MSFTNAPVTRALVLGVVALSIAASLFDVKHYCYIVVDTHLLRYRQVWRALTYQLCYTNSSEVLFACIILYHMRVVERIWGSSKYAVRGPLGALHQSHHGRMPSSLTSRCVSQSLVLVAALSTALVPPALLVLVLRPLSPGTFNYLPAGPTAVVFAVLVQYHAMVPHMYKYRVALTTNPTTADEPVGVTFSDKSYRYLLAGQLALSQWPGSVLTAMVGWVIGYAWRNDMLPGPLAAWRVPGWVVGTEAPKRSAEFEGLRRRLEGETTATGSTTGVRPANEGEANRRRTVGQQLMEQVRGAF